MYTRRHVYPHPSPGVTLASGVCECVCVGTTTVSAGETGNSGGHLYGDLDGALGALEKVHIFLGYNEREVILDNRITSLSVKHEYAFTRNTRLHEVGYRGLHVCGS